MSNKERPYTHLANYLPDASKITHPTIESMAIEYADSEIGDRVADVLRPLPESLQGPLKYTFANHVTKERPLSIVHIADELGVSREKSIGVAACIDVLWNVGIVLDDVYDKDETNALQQPSAWAKFGKAKALAASTAAVTASVAYVARKHGPGQAYGLSRELQRGVASLTQSRALPLDSPIEDYYDNYDMRSGFYTVAPIATIGKHSDAAPEQISGAQLSLSRMNRAGQMINDLQDFDQSSSRSRTSVFSDMRNGVSSIPMRHMWRTIDKRYKERFLAMHGNQDLTPEDEQFINRQITETDLASSVLSLIDSEYATARDEYVDAVNPSAATLEWLNKWLAYKQAQAQRVATALDKQTTGDFVLY